MRLAIRLLGRHSVPIVWTISEPHLNVNVKNLFFGQCKTQTADCRLQTADQG